MFSVADRESVLAGLVAAAQKDPSIVGMAQLGSGARGTSDEWSDIDIALQLAPGADEAEVVERWAGLVDARDEVADTTDVFAGLVRYRVFLLRSSLQIDLSFWPHDEFRETEPGFLVIFGTPNDPQIPATRDRDDIGMGWLYALHARSALARNRPWQAAMMVSELRNSVVNLMCERLALNAFAGREVDLLPNELLTRLGRTHSATLSIEDQDQSRILLGQLFLEEIERHDLDRSARLRAAFGEMSVPVPIRRMPVPPK